MPSYEMRIDLDAEQWRQFYEGRVAQVQVTDVQGRRLRFPAEHLRRFTSHDGVHGRFLLTTDEAHRFQKLERLG